MHDERLADDAGEVCSSPIDRKLLIVAIDRRLCIVGGQSPRYGWLNNLSFAAGGFDSFDGIDGFDVFGSSSSSREKSVELMSVSVFTDVEISFYAKGSSK